MPKPDVVGHDQEDVGSAFGRHHARRPVGSGLVGVEVDLAVEWRRRGGRYLPSMVVVAPGEPGGGACVCGSDGLGPCSAALASQFHSGLPEGGQITDQAAERRAVRPSEFSCCESLASPISE